MPKTVMGIDPGLTGAIACVRAQEVLTCLDLPLETGPANRRRLSAAVLVHLLTRLVHDHRVDAVALEQVSAMPGQGVSSMFSFGRSVGVIEGVVAALGLEVTSYSPASWKRRYGLIGRAKEASRTRALELYPAAAPWLTRVKDHGRADAILLAHTRLIQ